MNFQTYNSRYNLLYNNLELNDFYIHDVNNTSKKINFKSMYDFIQNEKNADINTTIIYLVDNVIPVLPTIYYSNITVQNSGNTNIPLSSSTRLSFPDDTTVRKATIYLTLHSSNNAHMVAVNKIKCIFYGQELIHIESYLDETLTTPSVRNRYKQGSPMFNLNLNMGYAEKITVSKSDYNYTINMIRNGNIPSTSYNLRIEIASDMTSSVNIRCRCEIEV